MMRFVILATMRRGQLDVPELLDDANQWRALESADIATAQEIEILRKRATKSWQDERDPAVSAQEMDRLTRGGREGRKQIDRMMYLSARLRA